MASHPIRALPVVLLIFATPTLGADRIIKFNRDVRPILSDKCFGCHGPDSVAKKIPLRLDSEVAASSVVSGGAQAKLIQRITADDKPRRMPPVYSGLEPDRRGDRNATSLGDAGREMGEALVVHPLPNAPACPQ